MKRLICLTVLLASFLGAQDIDYARIRNGPGISVMKYGALGNGTANDNTAIHSAITAAQLTGGTVYFPCGTFLFSTELTISKRITIQGGGMGSGTGNAKACTILKKTADVIGIHIADGAGQTVLRDFQLTSSASTGTSDGIVIGDITGVSGADEVEIRRVMVTLHRGNGINVRNGLSGVLDHVIAVANLASGVLLQSLNTSFGNVNAWRVYSLTSVGNTLDGIHMETAVANSIFGVDIEGNGRYGVYSNSPYTVLLGGDLEANATNNLYFGVSCFDCYSLVHDNQNNSFQGNAASYMFNLAGTGKTPVLEPLKGRFGLRGPFSTPLIFPTYGPSIVVAFDQGNNFEIDATNGTAFSIGAPTSTLTSLPQVITITIKNTSGGALGTATWSFVYHLAAWTQPANGFSRSITFSLDVNTFRWTELSRTTVDIPN